MRSHEVKSKPVDKNELKGLDLMSAACPIRAIITKDALKEGWDCPFAYVLALLSESTALTALTQLIGRVLRQPYAEATGDTDLDTAHVFCFDQDVRVAVSRSKKPAKGGAGRHL